MRRDAQLKAVEEGCNRTRSTTATFDDSSDVRSGETWVIAA
jgi:hypothetical protein